MAGSRLSRPMQRKLVMLLQCAVTDAEGRGRAARAARSLGERTVTELILQHQVTTPVLKSSTDSTVLVNLTAYLILSTSIYGHLIRFYLQSKVFSLGFPISRLVSSEIRSGTFVS